VWNFADFATKQDAMRRVAQGIVAQHGLPTSPEQAVEFARLAYDETNKFISLGKPAPQPTRLTPSGGHTANPPAAPAPASLKDAVQQAIARSAAGL